MFDDRLVFVFNLLILSRSVFSQVRPVAVTDEERLHEELFINRHYNADCRPVSKANETVNVQMAIVLKQIAEIDNLKEILQMLFWAQVTWRDFRLSWNESDFGGITTIVIPQPRIWTPDIILMNSAEQWKKWMDVNAMVHSDGTCRWVPPYMAKSYCPIDISWFPFDEQHCSLEFESWSYDSSKINLTLKNVAIVEEFYRRNSEWDLIRTSHAHGMIQYPCCTHPNSHIEFTFHLRRRILFYGFNLILPFSVLSVLSVVAFILPVESGERIGLEISTLLALSVHQLLVSDRVPPTSDAIPLMGIYFTCVMIMNAASLICMVVISNLYHRSVSMYPMPNWAKAIVCRRLGNLFGMRNNSMQSNAHSENYNKSKFFDFVKDSDSEIDKQKQNAASTDVAAAFSLNNAMGPENEPDVDWRLVALVIDRLCFYACIFYITIVTVTFYGCAFSMRWKQELF